MFGIKHNECVGFDSKWKVKKVSSETSTQTTDFAVSEKGTSTLGKVSIEVQTVGNEPTEETEADMQKLADWLNKIYPKVKREIDDANNSKAFRGYYGLSEDSCSANYKLMQSLNVVNCLGSGDKAARVSAMSWNQTGKTLALSCNHEHNSWCYHLGHVLIYTLNREDKIPDIPTRKLSVASCVMNLKFHPTHPAILVAGTFSGGITIWNVQKDEDDDVVATTVATTESSSSFSTFHLNGHEEAVTQLSWINDIDSAKTILLATSSADGLLKLWNFNLANASLTIKAKYKIKPPILPAAKNVDVAENATQKTGGSGIICFDFSKHIPDLFVVGIEGGFVVQCSVIGTNRLKGSTKEEPLLDPVFKYYQSHEGEITSVSISPNRKDMFMTSGTDGEIRIYLFGQDEPAQVIFVKNPLNDLSFVPYEEKLVVGCGINGVLEVFHLITGKPAANVTNEKIAKRVLTSLAVNWKKANLVAVGTMNGDLQLWNVPWRMFLKCH